MLKILFVLIVTKCAVCSNILFITGIPSPSHHIFNRALAFALAERGHNVTMFGFNEEKEIHVNFHNIVMEGVYEALANDMDVNDFIKLNAIETIIGMYSWGNMFCHASYKSKGLQRLMDYPKDFKVDLILFDMTMGQCLYPLIDKFNKPPVVAVSAFSLAQILSNAMGSHAYPSYYPHYGLSYTNEMSFFQRLHSFLLTYEELLFRNYYFANKQLEISKEYFGKDVRSVLEVERDITLLLSNTDPILDYPLPLPPNIIPVGGMHLKPAKKLPSDLQKIMDNSTEGVILFSLGSNLQSHGLGSEVKDKFLDAFRRLKEIVIWKYEAPIEDLPNNVITRKWLPQADILGHPNCKLFMSHGGGLSTQEALYYGVPVIGIPGFADQHKNIHKVVAKGLGLKLDFANLNSETIYRVIREVLDNPEYRVETKEASKKYRDQPQTPLQRAVFWTEYILRHKNADHLALPARNMHFYQTSNLDVVAFLLCAVFLIEFIIYKCVRLVCCSYKKEKLKRQ